MEEGLPVIRKESAGPRWQHAPGNPLIPARAFESTRQHLFPASEARFCRLQGISSGQGPAAPLAKSTGMLQPSGCESAPDLGFRVANACADLERAQRSLSGETVQTGDKETARARLTRCQGRLYLYFECLGVGVAGFSALAAERTSSFVNTARRNGSDSRK
jgi:hypothetical protein